MAEEKSLIVKWAVPICILGEFILFMAFAYLGWIYTSWASAQIYVMFVQVLAIVKFAVVMFLLIGYMGKRAGYTQEELNKWGDDALAGKPPL